MYIGIDFLIGIGTRLYMSEINIGAPAGATEYDLVYRWRHGKPSGIFRQIEALARKIYGTGFADHIHALPYLDDLRKLKIWMDGKGPAPENPAPVLRLEDKWIQYILFNTECPMIPSRIFRRSDIADYEGWIKDHGSVIIKRRIGRGGRGLMRIHSCDELLALDLEGDSALIQPYIQSRLADYPFSLRAIGFAGRFICLFASLGLGETSNHGLRVYVSKGRSFRLLPEDFKTHTVVQTAREAEIFFRGSIPDHLIDSVSREEVAEAEARIPENLVRKIKSIASSVSGKLGRIDPEMLPPSWIENSGPDRRSNDQ